MRSAILLASAILATSWALPQPLAEPQDIQFDTIDDAPTVTAQGAPYAASETAAVPTYDPDAAAASASADPITSIATDLVKRGPAATPAPTCTKLPKGYGPVSDPDTPDAFQSNSAYAQAANNAIVPDGYSLAFLGLTGATSAASYLGYYTLTAYDAIKCQQYCDATDGCYAFNMYMERDPSIAPAAACPNPASTTTIKCSLWGTHICDSSATNNGQWREQFHVLVAASNGYNLNAPPPNQPNFTSPVKLGGAINAPDNSFIGAKYYPGPYNPAQCTSACQSTTAYDRAHPAKDGSYATCAFVNS